MINLNVLVLLMYTCSCAGQIITNVNPIDLGLGKINSNGEREITVSYTIDDDEAIVPCPTTCTAGFLAVYQMELTNSTTYASFSVPFGVVRGKFATSGDILRQWESEKKTKQGSKTITIPRTLSKGYLAFGFFIMKNAGNGPYFVNIDNGYSVKTIETDGVAGCVITPISNDIQLNDLSVNNTVVSKEIIIAKDVANCKSINIKLLTVDKQTINQAPEITMVINGQYISDSTPYLRINRDMPDEIKGIISAKYNEITPGGKYSISRVLSISTD